MYKTYTKRVISFLVLLVFIMQIFAVSVFAETDNTQIINSTKIEEGQTADFILEALNDGEYYLAITYRTIAGRQINPEADLLLQGNSESFTQHVEFYRKWRDVRTNERFKQDTYGNEIVPEMEEVFDWQTIIVGISSTTGSLPVAIKAGQYKLQINLECEAVEISKVSFHQKSLVSYADYKKSNESKNKSDSAEATTIQAEIIEYKSDSSIIPTYDRSSPSIKPNYHDRIALNIIGGASYSEMGQWIEWNFEVNEDAFYAIDIRYQQDSLRGLGVGRRIYIDGEVPFAEFDNYIFNYIQDYKTVRLADDKGDAYGIYLTKGKHTLRMEVNNAHLEKEIIEIQDYILKCNEMYRDIISITGANPDVYRDYYLDKELPTLMPFLNESIVKLKDITARIEATAIDDKGSETSTIYDIIRVYEDYVKEAYKIPARLSEFKNSIDSLANMIITLQSQSLTLDYITINPVENPVSQNRSNVFEYLLFRFKTFLNSFVANYSVSTSDGKNGGDVKVWINMGDLMTSGTASGRDQMEVIKRMCDDTFTDRYGTHVSLSLVSAGETLTQAILAGKGPDVALFVPEPNVANLAIRGVLADVQKMDKFEEVSSQYHDSAFIPFKFGDGIYAMPVTQNFNMMFYRKDVFDDIGIEVPQTWDEFYEVQKVLVQHKLDIGVTQGSGTFEMFLFQHGASIYNEDLTKSGLKQQNAVDAFTQYTDLYVKHGLPLEFNFFNRFRTGEMPLGISVYTMYNQLSVAAPEIEGLWEMVPIPGTVQEDGSISKVQASTNIAAIIIATSKNLEGAYDFVEWWAGSDIQTTFGRQSEMLLGKSGRYNTANRVAFQNLNWSVNERNSLNEAWEHVSDLPQTAASYYIDRCITNAFRRVAYSYEDTRDVLYRYSDDIDFELERKKYIIERGGTNE